MLVVYYFLNLMRLRFQIMGRYNLNCTSIFFHGLLLFFFIQNTAATSTSRELSTETLEDDAQDPCKKVDCGQGNCVVSSASLLGFDCLCKPGWSKMQLGFITFPACTIPNCTINSQCGSGAPTPAPPPPANPPPFNPFNPCNLVWCGDGTCVANGLGYYCKCNNGSANLLNLTGVACLKECYIGADCKGVTFGAPLSPPPPPVSSNVPNCSTSLGPLAMMLLCLIFLACI